MSAPSGTILELGKGISVREYQLSDAKACSRHANNKKIWLQLRDRFPHPYTEDDAEFWIKHCQSAESSAPSGTWSAETGAEGPKLPTNYIIALDGEACGSIGLDFGTDVYFRTAELGYWLGEDHWCKGVMSKVVPAFVSWCWKTFGILIRLNGETVEDNIGSAALLKRAGFVFEGRRENALVKEGVVKSLKMFGALRPTPISS